jgi:hypothetical protein
MFEFTKNGKKRKKRRKESKKERKKEKGAGTVVRIFGLLGKFIEIDYVQYVRIIIRRNRPKNRPPAAGGDSSRPPGGWSPRPPD